MTLYRIPRAPRPPAPPAPPAPPTEDTRPVRRLWWPQRRHYVHSTWEVPAQASYPYQTGSTRGTRTSNRYAERWFWPGQRVRVSTVTMEVEGGLLNLFVPFAIVLAMTRPTYEVEVYELVPKAGEPK